MSSSRYNRCVCLRYETGKALVPAGHGVLGDMAVGVWAQLVAGIVYTPIDIVKERLQVRTVLDSQISDTFSRLMLS